MKATTSRNTRIHTIIELEDAEAIESWPGFTHRGKRVQPERMTFEVSRMDGRPDYVGRLSVEGRTYRKDGELGAQRASTAMFGWFEQRLEDDLELVLEPLLLAARAEAMKVLEG